MNRAFQSSVLRTHDDGDTECPTCRFLSGDQSVDTMISVIRNLDGMLAAQEKHNSILTDLVSDYANETQDIQATTPSEG